MSAIPIARVTPEEYLAADRAAAFRSEYVDGEVFAMSGGSRTHSRLISRLSRELENALEDRPCNVNVTELRLKIAPQGDYFYPDITVNCEDNPADPPDILTNPVLIAEVLSPSTERWDRTGKFAKYRSLPALREYVLISQDEMRVEWYTRNDSGDWIYRETNGPEGVCHLELLNVTIPLAALYKKITLDPAPNS